MSTLAPSYIFFTGKEDLAAESVGDALYKWNFTGRDVQGLFEEIWRLGDWATSCEVFDGSF